MMRWGLLFLLVTWHQQGVALAGMSKSPKSAEGMSWGNSMMNSKSMDMDYNFKSMYINPSSFKGMGNYKGTMSKTLPKKEEITKLGKLEQWMSGKGKWTGNSYKKDGKISYSFKGTGMSKAKSMYKKYGKANYSSKGKGMASKGYYYDDDYYKYWNKMKRPYKGKSASSNGKGKGKGSSSQSKGKGKGRFSFPRGSKGFNRGDDDGSIYDGKGRGKGASSSSPKNSGKGYSSKGSKGFDEDDDDYYYDSKGKGKGGSRPPPYSSKGSKDENDDYYDNKGKGKGKGGSRPPPYSSKGSKDENDDYYSVRGKGKGKGKGASTSPPKYGGKGKGKGDGDDSSGSDDDAVASDDYYYESGKGKGVSTSPPNYGGKGKSKGDGDGSNGSDDAIGGDDATGNIPTMAPTRSGSIVTPTSIPQSTTNVPTRRDEANMPTRAPDSSITFAPDSSITFAPDATITFAPDATITFAPDASITFAPDATNVPSVTALPNTAQPTVLQAEPTVVQTESPVLSSCETNGGIFGSLDENPLTIAYGYELETRPVPDTAIVQEVIPALEIAFNNYILPGLFPGACAQASSRRRRLDVRGITTVPADEPQPDIPCRTLKRDATNNCVFVRGRLSLFTDEVGPRTGYINAVKTGLEFGMANDAFVNSQEDIVKVTYVEVDTNGSPVVRTPSVSPRNTEPTRSPGDPRAVEGVDGDDGRNLLLPLLLIGGAGLIIATGFITYRNT